MEKEQNPLLSDEFLDQVVKEINQLNSGESSSEDENEECYSEDK